MGTRGNNKNNQQSLVFLTRFLGWLLHFQVWQKEWSNQIIVDHLRTHEFRVVKPEEEGTLDVKVKWNKGSQDHGSLFGNREQTKDNPVGQPLGVVSHIDGINRLEGHVGGVDKANKVGNELGSANEPNEASKHGSDKSKHEFLGDIKLLFQTLQSFCKKENAESETGAPIESGIIARGRLLSRQNILRKEQCRTAFSSQGYSIVQHCCLLIRGVLLKSRDDMHS